MTSPSQLAELIQRLHVLRRPNRALNRAVHKAIGRRNPFHFVLHDYTGDIRCALGTVPDGWGWSINSTGLAECWPNRFNDRRVTKGSNENGLLVPAIVIAALRARDRETK